MHYVGYLVTIQTHRIDGVTDDCVMLIVAAYSENWTVF